jgi:uncharacterized protein (TIGR02118 family)
MVKLIYCIAKKPELSVEEFQRYWREVHAPIAAKIPGVRRYVQCHSLPELYDKGPLAPAYDGAAEVWFDSHEAFMSAVGSPEVKAAREDETHFIDHSRSAMFFTEEKPVVGAPTEPATS